MPSKTLSLEINNDVFVELVHIPAGAFTLGSGNSAHVITLQEYYIGKYPLTNEQYSEFLLDTSGASPEHWVGRMTPPQSILKHPVTGVEWRDALAFVEWLTDLSGKNFRLPSEAEWEKAARADSGFLFPWGNDWIDTGSAPPAPRLYMGDDNWLPAPTVAVGSTSPQTDSPYGCADMCRNVWEWCSSAAQDYPYNATDGREEISSTDRVLRVLRGATADGKEPFNATERHFAYPFESRNIYGFRLALNP